MISPTGHGIRYSDRWGQGSYGASRDSGQRTHKGIDFVVSPVGQNIVAPCAGNVVRVKRPYADYVKNVLFSGILVRASDYEYTLFYFEPLNEIIGQRIVEGQIIGIAQDISLKYPQMIPHVHFHFDSINPEILMRLP